MNDEHCDVKIVRKSLEINLEIVKNTLLYVIRSCARISSQRAHGKIPEKSKVENERGVFFSRHPICTLRIPLLDTREMFVYSTAIQIKGADGPIGGIAENLARTRAGIWQRAESPRARACIHARLQCSAHGPNPRRFIGRGKRGRGAMRAVEKDPSACARARIEFH